MEERPDLKTLYHYTNASALLSILKTGKVWLTKHSYMNDPTEFNHARNIFYNFIEQHNAPDKFKLDRLRQAITEYDTTRDFFYFSLSWNPDSLTLWDRYGKGSGYALKFDATRLKDCFWEIDNGIKFMSFYEILYGREAQDNYIGNLVKRYLHAESLRGSESHAIDEIAELIFSAQNTLLAFKHEAYQEEGEVRAAFLLPNHKSLVADRPWKRNIKFRAIENRIVPYIEVDIDLSRTLTGVRLGPKYQDEREISGVLELLRYHDIDVGPMSLSEVPYR